MDEKAWSQGSQFSAFVLQQRLDWFWVWVWIDVRRPKCYTQRPKKTNIPSGWAYSSPLLFPTWCSKKFASILQLEDLKIKYVWEKKKEGEERLQGGWGGRGLRLTEPGVPCHLTPTPPSSLTNLSSLPSWHCFVSLCPLWRCLPWARLALHKQERSLWLFEGKWLIKYINTFELLGSGDENFITHIRNQICYQFDQNEQSKQGMVLHALFMTKETKGGRTRAWG